MRMMRFKSADGFRLGVVVGDALADLTAMQGRPWYEAVAMCDLDSDGSPAATDTTIYAVSGTNQLFMNNEGR